MAKMKLSEGGFALIPEGTHIFKVMEVDDSKYEDFGKLAVKMKTADGKSHSENFTLQTKDGEINEGALKAWSYFARTCLGNYDVEEIDTQDIVGCYIKATVKHEKYTRQRGERAGTEGTAVRLNDYTTAVGFGDKFADLTAPEDEDDDLDNFLDD